MAKRKIAESASSLQERDTAQSVEMLRRMYLIRAFDSVLPALYTKGLTRGSSHSSIGQEAVAVGACFALRDDDYITSTHRGHGHTIAKGGETKKMMAELLGRQDGFCRGRGGSMHIADFSTGMLGANGIVGAGIGIAAGAALSSQLLQDDRITLCFFGDGAINQGLFLEAGNMAALWNLPLILVCENNHFAMSNKPQASSSVAIIQRAEALGIPAQQVNGMDVLAVFDSVHKAAERVRDGGGPLFIEAECYRFEGHFSGDIMKYRDKAEFKSWQKRDPVTTFREQLIAADLLSEDDEVQLLAQVNDQIQESIEFAKASRMPESKEVSEDLYVA